MKNCNGARLLVVFGRDMGRGDTLAEDLIDDGVCLVVDRRLKVSAVIETRRSRRKVEFVITTETVFAGNLVCDTDSNFHRQFDCSTLVYQQLNIPTITKIPLRCISFKRSYFHSSKLNNLTET